MKVNINKCFQVLRELPLAVSLEQVEGWVKNYEPTSGNIKIKSAPWLGNFLKKFWQ